jgi:hypothetical protein
MLNTNKIILVRYKIRFLVLWFCIITFGFSATRPVAVMSKVIGDVKVDPVQIPAGDLLHGEENYLMGINYRQVKLPSARLCFLIVAW